MTNYIRFDWAMKRLLRDKANHEVLEGFMESLLGEKFTIVDFLESEGNQKSKDDKFNRVDMLVKNDKNELFIFEIQNEREYTYFQRILYGTPKVITDYISLGDDFDKIKKVYSISIVYFELGQGNDYVYHGMTEFRGLHNQSDVLMLSKQQNNMFFGEQEQLKSAGTIFPEYYILRVDKFNEVSSTPLDEWIYFLKTTQVTPEATAPGLAKVRECLKVESLSEIEKYDYYNHLEMIRDQRSMIRSSIMDGRAEGLAEGRAEGLAEGLAQGKAEGLAEGLARGKAEGKAEGLAEGLEQGLAQGLERGKAEGLAQGIVKVARSMLEQGLDLETISKYTGCSADEILKISKEHK